MTVTIVHEYYEGGTEVHGIVYLAEGEHGELRRHDIGRIQIQGSHWPKFKEDMIAAGVKFSPGFN